MGHHDTTALRRIVAPVAVAAALGVLGTTTAAAHDCYKEVWTDAAHAQVAAGTAWIEMSGFVEFVIGGELGVPADCVAHADEWVAAWMTANGVEQEPLIHTRATAGGGAVHREDPKDPRAFSYLGDTDFGFLVGQVLSEEDCAGFEFPEE